MRKPAEITDEFYYRHCLRYVPDRFRRKTSLQKDIERNRDLNIWGRQPMLLSTACPSLFLIGDLVSLPEYVSGTWVVTRANRGTVGVFPNYKTGLPHELP